MTEPIDARERRELCELLEQLGPDTPTLCEGWTTADLAAHLVLREHFHRSTPRRLAAEKAGGFPLLVARVRAGPPPVPWRIPGARTLLNGIEYFIHHEDVRRANGRGPRPCTPELQGLAWRTNGFLGRRLARRLRPFGLQLRTPDGRRRVFGREPRAIVEGDPEELVLFLSGRRSAATVALAGDAAAIEALRRTDMRL